MKFLKSFLYGLMAAATLGCVSSCQDNIDAPAIEEPVATLVPNTTIYDLKMEFWDDATNYIKEIGTKENGDHYIIAGRVITSDYAGNIFKSLTIQDETAALTFSINSYNLYMTYRVGQEIVVDLTGLHIGKYNGLQQIGEPEWYESGNAWEATFMSAQRFEEHRQLNGFPDPDKVIVHTLNSISDIPSGAEGLCKWQSQLVQLNNITFIPQTNSTTGETVTTFGLYHENYNQKISLDGTELTLRTSGYSNFYFEEMPTEAADMKCLLSYYGSAWQVMIIDYNDITNIGNPTLPAGSENNPWDVDGAIGLIKTDVTSTGWTMGYIVGTVAPEVTQVATNDDIEWGATATLANTVVIAPSADVTDIARCIIVPLPQNSVMREYVAIKNHPENVGKALKVYGTLAADYLGTYGITGNNGTASEFYLEGVTIEDTTTSATGDGTEASPYNCAQIIAMNPSSTTDAVASNVWVSGYVVGYYENYEAHFGVSTSQRANILISDNASASTKDECVCIQLVAQTATRTALNLVDNPTVLGQKVSVYGDIMKYNTLPGMKNTSNYALDGQTGGGDSSATANTLFSETFATSQGDFTIHNVSLSSSLSYVWSHDSSYGYMKASAYLGASYASDSWLVSPMLDLTSATSPVLSFDHVTNKFPSLDTAKQQVSLAVSVNGGAWQTLTIPTFSDNASWTFVNSGSIDLSAYAGKKILLGWHYTSADGSSGTWEIKNIAINGNGSITATATTTFPGSTSSGSGSDDSGSSTVTDSYLGNFNSFNGGEPKSSPYGTYTNATGWTAENSIILAGLASDGTEQNPRFAFIGDATTLAPTINGKTSAPGKIYSPTLTGGCKTLSFNYGYAFSGKSYSFTVNVKQNDTVVATKTITDDAPVQKQAYSCSIDVNVSGSFTIEIVNNSPTAQDKNVDRVSIWNLTWTK